MARNDISQIRGLSKGVSAAAHLVGYCCLIRMYCQLDFD